MITIKFYIIGYITCREGPELPTSESQEEKSGNYKEVKAMIYNPIFEEEKEKKIEFKQLKKEIKNRARKESMKQVVDRVYHLLQKKPILTIAALFHPIINWFSKHTEEQQIIGKI